MVTPATQVLAKGTTRQLTATGVYSDGTTADLTPQVAWSSSNSALATISNAAGSIGLATAISLGTVSLTATLGGVQGTTTLGISSATLSSIQVSTPFFAQRSPSAVNGGFTDGERIRFHQW